MLPLATDLIENSPLGSTLRVVADNISESPSGVATLTPIFGDAAGSYSIKVRAAGLRGPR